jgi:predicted metal-dependent phosphoesterase TrpH
MPGFDLHSHTVHSDGLTTVAANVAAAVAVGLDGLGVTDHDTTTHYDEAFAASEGTGLEIIAGTEFSSEHDSQSVHVLGLWVASDDAPLQAELERLRNERYHRAVAIVEKFNGLGVELSFARVAQLAADAPIGRPHIARAVVETGAAPDLQTVFDEYLADGGPAYVPKHAVDPVTAVQLLTAAGGVAVLAHPALFGSRDQAGKGLPDDVIEAMAEAGMAGIEADHPDHNAASRRKYRDMAKALGLVVTAGSDFHGKTDEGGAIGSATTSNAAMDELRARR